jgi:hypothetical protein
MSTKYYRSRREMKIIDLDALATRGRKPPIDTDFILTFGGAEFVIQYRIENARRENHPFIDIVIAPGDAPMTLDVCNPSGVPAKVTFPRGAPTAVVQLLLGQRLNADQVWW